jgi:hypothetical protein
MTSPRASIILVAAVTVLLFVLAFVAAGRCP